LTPRALPAAPLLGCTAGKALQARSGRSIQSLGPVMTAEASQSQQWREFRKRLRLYAILLYLMPVVLGAILYFNGILDRPFVAAVICGSYLFALFASQRTVDRFKCPECGKAFASTWYATDPHRRTCRHCGFSPPAEA